MNSKYSSFMDYVVRKYLDKLKWNRPLLKIEEGDFFSKICTELRYPKFSIETQSLLRHVFQENALAIT